MKVKMQIVIATALLLTGLAVNAVAAPEETDRPPSRQQLEKVRQRIETLRIWKLTKALDLDQKTSAALFPLLNRYDKRRHELERSLRDGMRELREAGKEGREPVIKGLLDRLDQHHREMQKLNEEEQGEIRKLLTVKQQAAFVLFQQEFQQEIRRIIDESRERREDRLMDRPAGKKPPRFLPQGGE